VSGRRGPRRRWDDDREWLSEAERRPPRPVGDALDGLARRLGAPAAASLSAVFTRWAEIAGDANAAHSRPVSLTDGTLVVAVDDPAWLTGLRFVEQGLLQRLHEVAGDGVVGRVEWRVEGARRGRDRGA
jgi:predicted nucleic acid-binding Zn ribbon protein